MFKEDSSQKWRNKRIDNKWDVEKELRTDNREQRYERGYEDHRSKVADDIARAGIRPGRVRL